MARKRKLEMPPGGRYTSAGRITIQFTVETDGVKRRLSQHSILPSEPQSYATIEEACAGFDRVVAYLAQEVDRHVTVAGFWQRWTDVDDWAWGAGQLNAPKRRPASYPIYIAKTRRFMELYADRPLASITELDVKRYMEQGGKPSQLAAISTFLKDAAEEGLRAGANPAAKLAARAKAALRQKREDNKVPPPKQAEVDAMLARCKGASIGPRPVDAPWMPYSFYAWMVVAVETGMRGAEIDGMQWEYLDGDTYQIDWQLHAVSRTLQIPKHGSRRAVHLSDLALEAIEPLREHAAETPQGYVFLNTQYGPWSQDSRHAWWTWDADGKPSPQALVDGVTIYQATRHFWASRALNEWGMSPYLASVLYGHKDGGKLLLDTYVKSDQDMALSAARDALRTQPVSLAARRRAKGTA